MNTTSEHDARARNLSLFDGLEEEADMIEPHHHEQAAKLAPGDPSHSPAFTEGMRYALAWCLAGRPEPTPERNRTVACPYERGTAERDAWNAGWGLGYKRALGLRRQVPELAALTVPGVLQEVALPGGGYVVVRESAPGVYAWEVTDSDSEDEPLREGGGYSSLAMALRDALAVGLEE